MNEPHGTAPGVHHEFCRAPLHPGPCAGWKAAKAAGRDHTIRHDDLIPERTRRRFARIPAKTVPGEPDAVQAARARQADIDRVRARADLIAEAAQLLDYQADPDTIAHRLHADARRHGVQDAPEVRELLDAADNYKPLNEELGHDQGSLEQAMAELARKLNLQQTVAAGTVTGFNGRQMRHIGGAPAPGTPVHVIRPGFTYTRPDGEQIQVIKADVEEATADEIAQASQAVKLPPQPPLKTPPERPYEGVPLHGHLTVWEDWQRDPTPAGRAVGFWQKYLFDQQMIRRVFDNMATGKNDLLDGVDLDSGFETYLEATDWNKKPIFDKNDLRNDLVSAARWFHEQLQNPQTTARPLYRGMLIDRKQIPNPGDTFSNKLASWAEDRYWAEYYAGQKPMPEFGRTGDTEVVFRLQGNKKSVPLHDGLGEHVAAGTYRVVRVTGSGRKRFITVEEVAPQ